MIIKVNQLTKYFGSQCVLDDVDFEIEIPTILALVAPNGTGKSTFLNIVTNIETANSGEITIFGKKNDDPSIFKDLTYLQDNSILYDDLSGKEHLKFVQNIHNISGEKVKELTDRLGMTGYLKKQVKKYSLGMKQHLLFAMAVLPNPKLILLDEPLNGLDPSSVLKVREILKELHKNGTTVIFSSHNLDEIDRLTNNIYFLHDGQFISANEYRNATSEYTFVVSSAALAFHFFSTISIQSEKMTERKIVVSLNKEEYESFLAYCKETKIDIFDVTINSEITQNIYFELFRGDTYGAV